MPEKTLPRESSRSVSFRQETVDGEPNDGLTLDGYATVYGEDIADGAEPTAEAGWAFIDSWEGTFWERFKYRSFAKSLQERTPKMQYDHGRHPLLGSLPLGNWTTITEEKSNGLHTIGRVLDNWLTEPFRQAIASEGVDGMSIRFDTVRDEWRTVGGELVTDVMDILDMLWSPPSEGPLRRTVKEAKLLEAGPVTWPAYEATSVDMRSKVITIDLGNLKDPGMRQSLAQAVLLADSVTPEPVSPPKDEIDVQRESDPDRELDDSIANIRTVLSGIKSI